jgi:hypothetical protein
MKRRSMISFDFGVVEPCLFQFYYNFYFFFIQMAKFRRMAQVSCLDKSGFLQKQTLARRLF